MKVHSEVTKGIAGYIADFLYFHRKEEHGKVQEVIYYLK